MELDNSRTIVLPIGLEEYNSIIGCRKSCRKYLDNLIEQYPELFPITITKGYSFSGLIGKSTKQQNLLRRRIRIKHPLNKYDDYLLHPCFVIPYLRGDWIFRPN